MEEEMRLKVVESVAEIPSSRINNIHNVSLQGGLNRNQQEKLTDTTGLHSTQWASNYVTTPALLKDQLTNNGTNFNNNITASLQQQRVHRTSYSVSSDLLSESSPDDSLGDYDVDAQQSSSSLDVSPQEDEYRCFSHEDLSDTDSLSDDGNCHSDLHPGRGIVNPNYPGFQHLAHQLHPSDTEPEEESIVDEDTPNNNVANNNNNNNNNNGDEEEEEGDQEDGLIESKIDSVNHLDSVENFQKAFYDKPKFNIPIEDDQVELVLANDLNAALVVESVDADCVNLDTTYEEVDEIESVLASPEFIETIYPETTFLGGGSFETVFIDSSDTETVLLEDDVSDSLPLDSFSSEFPEVNESLVTDAEKVICESEEVNKVGKENDDILTLETDIRETQCNESVLAVDLKEEEEVIVGIRSGEEIGIVESDNSFPKTIAKESERTATVIPVEVLTKEAESIESAFADELLNKSINADIANIKTAFVGKSVGTLNLLQQYKSVNVVLGEKMALVEDGCCSVGNKMEEVFLSNAVEEHKKCDVLLKENIQHGDSNRAADEREKFTKEEHTANEKEKDDDSVVPRKKEKMEINYSMKKNRHSVIGGGGIKGMSEMGSCLSNTTMGGVVRRREFGPRAREMMLANRRSMPAVGREKKRTSPEIFGGFDVYNIETAMPKIDLDAIESHLKDAREEDRRRRNDREEIRKRLAMGSDADEYYSGERPGRKPSLQARLQSGMNLQICFMNETVSDTESPGSDTEPATSPIKLNTDKTIVPRSQAFQLKSPNAGPGPIRTRPSTSTLTLPLRRETDLLQPMTEADFFARQARLQAEARMALAQAKEMAHMQMEIERQRQKKSPITEMVRSSLEKVGIPFPEDRRRVSRQILTEMNLAQLQVIVNDLHTQIEVLNELLVKFLMNRDDLHMEQDSMLVDIEDLTRYLGAKEQPAKDQLKDQSLLTQNNNLLLLSNKPKLTRIAAMVKK